MAVVVTATEKMAFCSSIFVLKAFQELQAKAFQGLLRAMKKALSFSSSAWR